MERRSRIVRAIWALCLLLAGVNHARILVQHGLAWDYGGVGVISAAYWSSLTILDPLAAILLFTRKRVGVSVTIVLIVTNVVHNLSITAILSPEGEFLSRVASSPTLLSQIGFMLFVVATGRTAGSGNVDREAVQDRGKRNREGR